MKHWNKVSLAFAIALTLWAWNSGLLATLGEAETRSATGIIAQVSATMLGFLIAALSVLASISGHRLIRNMQSKGYFRVLLRHLFWNSSAFGLTLVLSLACIFHKGDYFTDLAFASLCGAIYSIMLLIDISFRFWLVLSNLVPEPVD